MKEWKYLITEEQLNEMIKFAQKHPDAEFYMESLNDGLDIEDEFLSCTFYARHKNKNIHDYCISNIWELSYGEGEYTEKQN